MPAITNKDSRKDRGSKHFTDRKFDNVEETAQKKTDHAWNTVFKHVNWDKFEEMRKKQ